MKNSKILYPPQTGKYAVKVKNGRGWHSYKTARFHISVGQEYHEGEKFFATMEWARHRFDKIIICVNDTLQRYNYAYKDFCAPDEAFLLSKKLGDEWIERNSLAISQLPNREVYRWEDWRTRRDFVTQYNYVLELYNKVPIVKDIIEQEVLTFWKRRILKEGALDYSFDAFKKASIEYLLEETAAFFLMFKQDEAVDIYPGSVLLPCVLAQKYCIGGKVSQLGERAFTRIDFSRNFQTATPNNDNINCAN